MTQQTIEAFAALNASLNGTSAVLAGAGFALIRTGRFRGHAILMIAAVTTSAAFLCSYLYLHFHTGRTVFPNVGAIRTIYLGILLTHTVLAAAVPFLVLATVILAVLRRWPTHRRLARWTLPIWLYVSVTGVVIYWMLYHLAPRLAAR